ncbi:MAG TPA: protein-glutamate O-methyltransferase CheR [Polyangiales bacterium]|nr:protein-glutamate O-methyltransferase CheR [Polyangiales bacterium]
MSPFDADATVLADTLTRLDRGFEFGSYARSGLLRRLCKHVRESGFDDCTTYAAYLSEHEQEYERLSAAVLVHRTEFFRDAKAWLSLSHEALPLLLADKPPDENVRVWCAGCATGQEAYSLAITLAEALGIDAYHNRVTVFATDVSESVLRFARAGTYGSYAMQELPLELRDKYFKFSRSRGTWTVSSKLRAKIVFGRHDLLRDPQLRQMDVIVWRNTLIYFTQSARRRILLRFCVGLRPTGLLFTGLTEIPQASVDMLIRAFAGQPLYRMLSGPDRRALAALLRALYEWRTSLRELKAPGP